MPVTVGSNRTADQSQEQANQYGSNKICEFIGIVAKDKEINSKVIEVFIKDLTPFYEGKLEPKKQEYDVTAKNYSEKLTLSNTIPATWYGGNTNKRYPPDVKKGEQVTVFLYSDQDVYYWDSLGRDDDKRRTERTEISAANTPEGPTPLHQENTYGLHIDTQEGKTLDLHTSTSAGEQFKYQLFFDGKGQLGRICDDQNNEIAIESSIPRIYARNNEGTMIELAKKNLTFIAPEDLLIKAGRQACIDVPALTFKNTEKGGATVINAKDLVMECEQSFVVDSPKTGFKSAVEANSIVSGHHYATGYSTIEGGYDTYDKAEINIADGSVTNSSAAANNGDGSDASNRHCTAFEDFKATIDLICADLERIDSKIGYGNNTAGIRAAAEKAIMNLNRGK